MACKCPVNALQLHRVSCLGHKCLCAADVLDCRDALAALTDLLLDCAAVRLDCPVVGLGELLVAVCPHTCLVAVLCQHVRLVLQRLGMLFLLGCQHVFNLFDVLGQQCNTSVAVLDVKLHLLPVLRVCPDELGLHHTAPEQMPLGCLSAGKVVKVHELACRQCQPLAVFTDVQHVHRTFVLGHGLRTHELRDICFDSVDDYLLLVLRISQHAVDCPAALAEVRKVGIRILKRQPQ